MNILVKGKFINAEIISRAKDDNPVLPSGIKPIKKTPSGTPSTSEEVLVELAQDYPLPKIILEFRSLAKLKSTYTDKLPRMINKRDILCKTQLLVCKKRFIIIL